MQDPLNEDNARQGQLKWG